MRIPERKGAIERQIKTIALFWYYFACYSECVFHDLKNKILIKIKYMFNSGSYKVQGHLCFVWAVIFGTSESHCLPSSGKKWDNIGGKWKYCYFSVIFSSTSSGSPVNEQFLKLNAGGNCERGVTIRWYIIVCSCMNFGD